MSGPEIRFENWASPFLHPKSGVGADIEFASCGCRES